MIYLCSTCNHWAGSITSYAAACTIGSYPGRTLFDMCCDKHSHAPTVAPDMQSAARGTPIPMVQMFVPGAKP